MNEPIQERKPKPLVPTAEDLAYLNKVDINKVRNQRVLSVRACDSLEAGRPYKDAEDYRKRISIKTRLELRDFLMGPRP